MLSVLGARSQAIAATSAADWIIPKICADGANKPVSADPFLGCPKGSRLRALKLGDPLPYRKIDNTKRQYKDIYPRVGPDGMKYIIATFDWLDPKNGGASSFKVWEDGYDSYIDKDGWASGSETRMGTGEYATTFFGEGCKNYQGLVFFPTSFLRFDQPSGSGKLPIAGIAWEENDQEYPGVCPSHLTTDQITTWSLVHDFPFGGVNGHPVKPLDAIVTTMGLRTIKDERAIAQWMAYGHLEVFYFTKTYGLTRWESWAPAVQLETDGREPAAKMQEYAANVTSRCGPGPNMTSAPFTLASSQKAATRIEMVYQGTSFVMNDCRDWSNIVLQDPPVQPPAWPISGLNFLRNFHFNGATLPIRNWDGSHLPHGNLLVSTTPLDTTIDTPKPLHGVAYLQLDCRRGCESDRLFQDVPLTSTLPRTGAYTIGVIGRAESGSGALEISLSQLDEAGATLSTATYLADDISSQETSCDNAGRNCRQFSFEPAQNSGSVVLSSNFVNRTVHMTIDKRARTLRFAIAPKSANVFDLVSAWLMPAY